MRSRDLKSEPAVLNVILERPFGTDKCLKLVFILLLLKMLYHHDCKAVIVNINTSMPRSTVVNILV